MEELEDEDALVVQAPQVDASIIASASQKVCKWISPARAVGRGVSDECARALRFEISLDITSGSLDKGSSGGGGSIFYDFIADIEGEDVVILRESVDSIEVESEEVACPGGSFASCLTGKRVRVADHVEIYETH